MPEESGIETLAQVLDAAENLTDLKVSPHVVLSRPQAAPTRTIQHAALRRLSIVPPSSLQYLLLPYLESLQLNIVVLPPDDKEELSEPEIIKNFLSESQSSIHELIIADGQVYPQS
jgi:hypothetical protein